MASAMQSDLTAGRLLGERSSAVQRYFEASLFLLVATGSLSIISTGKLDLASTIAVPTAIFLKAYRLWRGHGPELSARLATWLVLAYFLFFPLDLWVFSRARAEGAPNPALYAALLATIHLLLFATVIRLYSARTNRDHAFLAVLAVGSMLASAILTVETSFLFALGIFLVLAVSTFVAMEIRRSATDAISSPLAPGTPVARQLNRTLGLISVLVAVSALALGGLIFFVLPRTTTGYMSGFNLQPKMMTGFSDDMTLGTIGRIQQDPSVVMRVKVDGDPARAEDVHWRGLAFTTFDGKRWFTEGRDKQVLVAGPDGVFLFGAPSIGREADRTIRYTVLMEPIASDAIFVAPGLQMLRGAFQQDVVRPGFAMRRNILLLDETGSLTSSGQVGMKLRYEGASRLPDISPATLRNDKASYPLGIQQSYLQVPDIDPRIGRLAEQITAHSKNPYDKASAIELYLKTRYAYTLDLRGDPGKDPLAYFLFARHAGHCEYFASAMTVMLRSVRIPARYVTGFLPGEFNNVGGDYIIRASDAHAWVEAYFPGYGWITFDPTPGGDVRRPTGFLARAAMYWDWFQLTWSEWFVNYDFAHQLRLGSDAHRTTSDWGTRARVWYQREQDRAMKILLAFDRRIEASRYTLPSLLAFLIVLLFWLRGQALIRYAVARWNLGARRGGKLTASLATFEYQEMLKILERRGWKKSAAQTPREFAAAIPTVEIAAPVSQLTELYQAARFGSRTAQAEQASALLRNIRELLRKPRTS